MTINPLSSNLIQLLSQNDSQAPDTDWLSGVGVPDGRFANILTDAFNTARQEDAADKATSLELLMGKSDDLSGVIIAAQKAELSLNLALQIRNKFVDAYNEIMRMQV